MKPLAGLVDQPGGGGVHDVEAAQVQQRAPFVAGVEPRQQRCFLGNRFGGPVTGKTEPELTVAPVLPQLGISCIAPDVDQRKSPPPAAFSTATRSHEKPLLHNPTIRRIFRPGRGGGDGADTVELPRDWRVFSLTSLGVLR